MNKILHIVTHDVPWPVVHGGFFDLFYKLVALHKSGVQIHLHCYKSKNGKEAPELEKYCHSVKYYERNIGIKNVSFSIPYIVHSRTSHDLYTELKKDLYPVLLEGIHCTALLDSDMMAGRKVFVRLHNIEYKYYRQLEKNEHNFFKKLYFKHESDLLKKYERNIAKKATFLAVNADDANEYKNKLGANVFMLPVFLPWKEIKTHAGQGCFCLYHGNLSINENEEAVTWLLNNVFKNTKIPLVIAGRNPSAKLISLLDKLPQICLVINPSEKEMQDLVIKAQIHILPSFNNTGVKLKLLNALFNGRHCIVNDAAVAGSGLSDCCNIANNASEFKHFISALYQHSFTKEEIQDRADVLTKIYDNEKNVQRLMSLIW